MEIAASGSPAASRLRAGLACVAIGFALVADATTHGDDLLVRQDQRRLRAPHDKPLRQRIALGILGAWYLDFDGDTLAVVGNINADLWAWP